MMNMTSLHWFYTERARQICLQQNILYKYRGHTCRTLKDITDTNIKQARVEWHFDCNCWLCCSLFDCNIAPALNGVFYNVKRRENMTGNSRLQELLVKSVPWNRPHLSYHWPTDLSGMITAFPEEWEYMKIYKHLDIKLGDWLLHQGTLG